MGENYFGITDTGKQRTNNEDSFIAQPVFNGRFVAACVIDGVGGYEGGEIAASLARQSIIDSLDKLPGDINVHMISVVSNANDAIIKEKQLSAQNELMACVVTLAVVDMEKNVFYFAHVGDTRLYLFRDGSLIKITKDHSAVGFLEDSGRLTEEAAMLHPKRNEVNKVLGHEKQIGAIKDYIDTGESPFLPGDTILVCSDGLTDMITAGKITSILNTEEELSVKCSQLVAAANDAGGKDNITVVLVHNGKSPVQHIVTKPLIAQKKKRTNGNAEPRIIANDLEPDDKPVKNNSSKKSGRLLLMLSAGLIIILLWWIARISRRVPDDGKILPVNTIKQRNKQEAMLMDSLGVSSVKTIRLSPGIPIVVSDTLLIKNDSLHLIGNGVSFTRDSSYTGPAFMIMASCKYILLDSIDIGNFNLGILVQSKGLHLKNVRFRNCMVPLQFQQQLPQNIQVSGKQAEPVFYLTDSTKR